MLWLVYSTVVPIHHQNSAIPSQMDWVILGLEHMPVPKHDSPDMLLALCAVAMQPV